MSSRYNFWQHLQSCPLFLHPPTVIPRVSYTKRNLSDCHSIIHEQWMPLSFSLQP